MMSTSNFEINTTNTLFQGTVYQKQPGSYRVRAGTREISCALSPNLRYEGSLPDARRYSRKGDEIILKRAAQPDPVVVGDEVRLIAGEDGHGLIIEVLPRRSQLSRRAPKPKPGSHPLEQVLAANVDRLVPVFAAATPPPHWNLLDRYLVAAEQAGLPALICITKLDLVEGLETDLDDILNEYNRLGYPSILTSTMTGAGLEELRRVLDGSVSVLVGKSGVGKTSLLNALGAASGQPGAAAPRRVGEVSRATGKGRHTTSAMELVPLSSGGALVDTPGEREFGIWGVDPDELAQAFPEMRPYLGRCKFGLDCRHDEEPGCAVRKAVVAGQISPRRYRSFVRLMEDP